LRILGSQRAFFLKENDFIFSEEEIVCRGEGFQSRSNHGGAREKKICGVVRVLRLWKEQKGSKIGLFTVLGAFLG
jgi:hypothetical protein